MLGHALPSGDVAELIERALDSLVEKLEKQKFAKCASPRPQRGAAKGRHIPAEVKRAVWERDGGRCTFVSEQGRRCESRKALEYDHVDPVARGGQATVGGIRLLCRVHNQHAAECEFSAEFIRAKREEAQRMVAEAKARAAAEAASQQRVAPHDGTGRPAGPTGQATHGFDEPKKPGDHSRSEVVPTFRLTLSPHL